MQAGDRGGGRWPIVIAGFGATLLLVLGIEEVMIVATDVTVPEGHLAGAVTSIPFILGLLVGGYWLDRSGLATHRYRRIANWCFGCALGTVALMLGIVLLILPASLLLVVGTARWAASIGGIVGLSIGVFEARAIDRALQAEDLGRRQRQTQRERDRLDEFASVISHDLRNPLNVALGRLQLAQEEAESEHLAAIEPALRRMDRIIEDVLWLAREGRDIGATEAVDLEAAVTAAWSMVAEGTDGPRLRVTDDGGLGTIETDSDRLDQLLENVLRNAIQHGGDDVTVTVGPLPDGFYLEDDGVGIAEADRESVFDAGYSTSTEGNGLGLRIVAQVAEAHGWDVRVTEGAEGGARFEITGVTFVAK